MSLTRNASNVLSKHVVFEVECIDRMYLNVYVPGLQYAGGLVGYVHRHLGTGALDRCRLARLPRERSRLHLGRHRGR